jgi:predicted nucleotidyltransferase
MRQTASSGSVRAIWLDRERVLERARAAASEAALAFPDIREIRLFGSIARNDHTGLSDVDLFLLIESGEKNPLERTKPYYRFFSERLEIALDVVTATEEEAGSFKEMLAGSIVLYSRVSPSVP